jgi:hypothetical protein
MDQAIYAEENRMIRDLVDQFIETDVLVLGGGIAGPRAAIEGNKFPNAVLRLGRRRFAMLAHMEDHIVAATNSPAKCRGLVLPALESSAQVLKESGKNGEDALWQSFPCRKAILSVHPLTRSSSALIDGER